MIDMATGGAGDERDGGIAEGIIVVGGAGGRVEKNSGGGCVKL